MRASVTIEAMLVLPLLTLMLLAVVYYATLTYSVYTQPPTVTGSSYAGRALRVTFTAPGSPEWAAVITPRAAYIAGVNATLECSGGVCIVQAPLQPAEVRDAILAMVGPWGLYKVRLGDLKGCMEIRAGAGFRAVLVDPTDPTRAVAVIDDDLDGDAMVCGLQAGLYNIYIAEHGVTSFERLVVPPGGVAFATPSAQIEPGAADYMASVNETVNITVPVFKPITVTVMSPCVESSYGGGWYGWYGTAAVRAGALAWGGWWTSQEYYGGLPGGVLYAVFNGRPAFTIGEAYDTHRVPLNITYHSSDCLVYDYDAYSDSIKLYMVCIEPGTLSMRVSCTEEYVSEVWSVSVESGDAYPVPLQRVPVEANNSATAESPGWLVAWYKGSATVRVGNASLAAPTCTGGYCGLGVLVESGAMTVEGGVAQYYPLLTVTDAGLVQAEELNATVLAETVHPAQISTTVLPLRYYWVILGPGYAARIAPLESGEYGAGGGEPVIT